MQTEAVSNGKVPTVDLGELGVHCTEEPSEQEWERVTRQLEQALSQDGCAYLNNHGMPDEVINKVISNGTTFFKLDADAKTQWIQQDFITRYVTSDSERYGGKGPEQHESFLFRPGNYGSPDKEASPFKTAVTPFHHLIQVLSRRLLTTLSLSIGKNRDYFLNMHLDSGTEKGISVYRMNYYPGSSDSQGDIMGFGAHIDFSTFTLLFSNDTKGLQIRDSAGQWFDVSFVPGTVLLMAGEFLHLHSEKRFTPAMHRVLLPSKLEPERPHRCTLIYFVHADGHQPMWPPSNDPASPEPPLVKDYLIGKFHSAQSSVVKN